MKVRVTKLSTQRQQPEGLADGYEVEMYLLEEPQVGQPLSGLRVKRNSVEALGWFQSSPATGVNTEDTSAGKYWVVSTENSRYFVEEIDETEVC